MKKKIGILLVVIALIGFGNIQINAAAPDELPFCENCLLYGPWFDDAHQGSSGDCYAGEEWCGTILSCTSGVFICQAYVCNTTYIGCNIVNPN